MINLFIKIFILSCLPIVAIAVPSSGLGLVAKNMLEPVGLMNDFVNSACFVMGIAFLFSALIKYIEHRRSPMMIPISTVVFLTIAGLLLLAMPFAYMLTENGIHFSLMR